MQKIIKAIIIDDEDLAREGLQLMLKKYVSIEVVASCSNGIDAVKKIHECKPDVIFLDVNMPSIDGFEVLELLGEDAPLTIFVTAFDDFAVKAFEENALDYLLKPVNPQRLEKSIRKVEQNLNPDLEAMQKVVYQQQQEKRKNLARILIRDKNNVHVIAIEDVYSIEAQDDYVAIRTKGNIYLKLERLTRLEQQLDPQKFIRIHRSYIINMDYVQRIENQKFAILKNGIRLPISRSGYSRFFKD